MNLGKLQAAQSERGVRSKFLAERCGMSPSGFCRKIHGSGGDFTINEARDISVALRLSLAEINDIFLTGCCQRRNPKSLDGFDILLCKIINVSMYTLNHTSRGK